MKLDLSTISKRLEKEHLTMKIRDLIFGPERTAESDLKNIIDRSDERLNQKSSFDYSPSSTGEVNLGDLAKAHEPDLGAPDDGFPPQPVSGGVKSPW